MTAAIATFVAGVMMAAGGQVLLKKGSTRGAAGSMLMSLIDPFAIAGYLLMLASTVTSTIALKVLPLKLTAALLPLGYIVVVFLSVTVLREKMRRHHFWGMLIILT